MAGLAIQRDLDMLEKCTDWKIILFKKSRSKGLHLRRNNPGNSTSWALMWLGTEGLGDAGRQQIEHKSASCLREAEGEVFVWPLGVSKAWGVKLLPTVHFVNLRRGLGEGSTRFSSEVTRDGQEAENT